MSSDSPSVPNVNFHIIDGVDNFKKILSADLERLSLIYFWATWAAPCTNMNNVVQNLAIKYPDVLVLQVDADVHYVIADSFDVQSVPTCIILRGHTFLERIVGVDVQALTQALTKNLATPSFNQPLSRTNQKPAPPMDTEDKENPKELVRLQNLMKQSKVVLFMKGSPNAPKCGFSSKIVAILREKKVEFTYFDILQDESVRQGLKTHTNWPTFPQLINNGELVGGLDIVKEMVHSGEFDKVFA